MSKIPKEYIEKIEHRGWDIYVTFHKETDPKWYDYYRYTRIKGEESHTAGGHFKSDYEAVKAAFGWIDESEDRIARNNA